MKGGFIEILELHVELHGVIEDAVDNGALEPRALELIDRIFESYRAPLGINIMQTKAKLGMLHHARNLLEAHAFRQIEESEGTR